MRTAVIADIHANGEALDAVFERIRSLDIDETVCLGDIVGYNAEPNECIAALKREKVVCVLGNHDAVAARREEPDTFSPLARTAIQWTSEQLHEESRQFLQGLKREKFARDFFLFHGSIHDTNRYLLFREDAVDNLRLLEGFAERPLIGFFGHTHVGAVWSMHQGLISSLSVIEELVLMPDREYLINPGSVGQPRDGDPRAAFLVYDDQGHTIDFQRVEYDIRRCQGKIQRAGLPQRLAERLERGR